MPTYAPGKKSWIRPCDSSDLLIAQLVERRTSIHEAVGLESHALEGKKKIKFKSS